MKESVEKNSAMSDSLIENENGGGGITLEASMRRSAALNEEMVRTAAGLIAGVEKLGATVKKINGASALEKFLEFTGNARYAEKVKAWRISGYVAAGPAEAVMETAQKLREIIECEMENSQALYIRLKDHESALVEKLENGQSEIERLKETRSRLEREAGMAAREAMSANGDSDGSALRAKELARESFEKACADITACTVRVSKAEESLPRLREELKKIALDVNAMQQASITLGSIVENMVEIFRNAYVSWQNSALVRRYQNMDRSLNFFATRSAQNNAGAVEEIIGRILESNERQLMTSAEVEAGRETLEGYRDRFKKFIDEQQEGRNEG